MSVAIECVLAAGARVGEAPFWSAHDRMLWWVDIVPGSLHRFDPATGRDESWPMPSRIGFACPRRNGGVIVGLEEGLAFFDPETATLEPFSEVNPSRDGLRFNDATVSPEGRLVATTMQTMPPGGQPNGAVLVIDPDGTARTVFEGLWVGNGLAFSPDGRTLYVADTHEEANRVWACDWDGDEGVVTGRRPFFDGETIAGRPDGAAVDSEGGYWVACPYGWQVIRIDTAGRIDRQIAMPIEKPTKPCFGGSDQRTLFVTSIGGTPSPGTEHLQPLAGGLFTVDVGATGRPVPLFEG